MLVRKKTLNVRGWMNLRFTDSSYIDEEEIEQEPVTITVASTPDIWLSRLLLRHRLRLHRRRSKTKNRSMLRRMPSRLIGCWMNWC